MNGDSPKCQPVHVTESIDLSRFEIIKVLDESSISKMITVEAKYKEDNQAAVIRLERTPLAESAIHDLMNDKNAKVTQEFANDIYGNYFIVPTLAALNCLKATIIHPADDQVITKYTSHDRSYVQETSDDYEHFVKQYAERKLGPLKQSIQWLYNILSHESEVDRIVYENGDKVNGFIMLPDLKANTTSANGNDFYLLAICHAKNIKSLRDLNQNHLPLLNNILNEGCDAIMKQYHVDRSKLRVFVHYQPSFYHFHVHFKPLINSQPSDRDNLLTDVINNITLVNDYYQRATLTYPLSHLDPLYEIFNENRANNEQ